MAIKNIEICLCIVRQGIDFILYVYKYIQKGIDELIFQAFLQISYPQYHLLNYEDIC